jgi:hypothetical protein
VLLLLERLSLFNVRMAQVSHTADSSPLSLGGHTRIRRLARRLLLRLSREVICPILFSLVVKLARQCHVAKAR